LGGARARVPVERFLKRTTLPEVEKLVRKETGAAFPAAVGITEETKALSLGSLFKGINKELVSNVALPGFKKLPSTPGLTFLKDKWVPEFVHDELVGGTRAFLAKTSESQFLNFYRSALRAWKAGKTVFNPPTVARNFVSNLFLVDMARGFPALMRLPQAVLELWNKGKYFREAVQSGLLKGTLFEQDLQRFLPEYSQLAKLASTAVRTANGNLATRLYDRLLNIAGPIYGNLEKVAKLQVFIEARKAGATIARATKEAEESIFAYHKITPFEKMIRDNAIPFYTFTRKVIPFTFKTLLEHPQRIARYPKVVEEIEKPTAEKAIPEQFLPEFIREQRPEGKPAGFVRVGKKGERDVFANLQYLFPFGNVLLPSIPQALKPEPGQLPFGASLAPPFTELPAQVGNVEFFTGQPITEAAQPPEEQLKARAASIGKFLLPSALTTGIPRMIEAARGIPPTTKSTRARGLLPTALGEFAGLRTAEPSLSVGVQRFGADIQQIRSEMSQQINIVIRDRAEGRISAEEATAKIKRIIEYNQRRLQERITPNQ
jgi:hypothetical protein